jgi:hypothetical protein
MNTNIYEIPKEELYWEKEKICDMAFELENKIKKAKTLTLKDKLFMMLYEVLDVQSKYEKRLIEEFGYNN